MKNYTYEDIVRIADGRDPYGWIEMQDGMPFWPMEPRESEVRIEDIATGLSRVTRFAGHSKGETGYTVAQHSVHVSLLVLYLLESSIQEYRTGSVSIETIIQLALNGLLHDASEGYGFGDIPHPIKRNLFEYQRHESNLQSFVFRALGIHDDPSTKTTVKICDTQALLIEKRDVKESKSFWFSGSQPPPPPELGSIHKVWGSSRASDTFLDVYNTLIDMLRTGNLSKLYIISRIAANNFGLSINTQSVTK